MGNRDLKHLGKNILIRSKPGTTAGINCENAATMSLADAEQAVAQSLSKFECIGRHKGSNSAITGSVSHQLQNPISQFLVHATKWAAMTSWCKSDVIFGKF